MFSSVAGGIVCKQLKNLCTDNKVPADFKSVFYSKFMKQHSIQPEEFKDLSVPLEEYLNCTIEFAGKTKNCNMENVLGSFYTKDEFPQFCFSIYSLWGKPNKKREKIPKGAIMKFHFFLNFTRRTEEEMKEKGEDNGDEPKHIPVGPKYNPPTDPSVQLAVHSPYFLPSPYLEGTSVLGGRAYEIRIQMSESHLLPLPYQTNCTDYMTSWRERGGKGPINQLGVIQECRLNKTYEVLGCVPVTFDYPHNYSICKVCESTENCKYNEPPNDCSLLAEHYNQPCDSMIYTVDKQDKIITEFHQVTSMWTDENDGFTVSMAERDCEGVKLFTKPCSEIDIDVLFDRFQITNMTYNPKFESLELFSVIGGYMGMYLGISLLAIFDVISEAIAWIAKYFQKKKNARRKVNKMIKTHYDTKHVFVNGTKYNVW